jgi:regulator of RNase E activity RraB
MKFFRRPRSGDRSKDVELAAGDREVLNQLEQLGADMERPLETRHYLYFKDRSAAETAAERLREQGYEIAVDVSAAGPGWLALASNTQLLSPSIVEQLRREMTILAESLGGIYDGWEAAPNV